MKKILLTMMAAGLITTGFATIAANGNTADQTLQIDVSEHTFVNLMAGDADVTLNLHDPTNMPNSILIASACYTSNSAKLGKVTISRAGSGANTGSNLLAMLSIPASANASELSLAEWGFDSNANCVSQDSSTGGTGGTVIATPFEITVDKTLALLDAVAFGEVVTYTASIAVQ